MIEPKVERQNKSGKIVAIALALLVFGVMALHGSAETAAATAETDWVQQSPYPSRFAINGVDMVTPTEAWAVAYTDILHTADGGVTWEKQTRPGAENLYAVDFFDNQHGIAMGNTTLYTSNGGITWNQSNAFGERVEMADANLAFITDHRTAGYQRSTNGGATWTFHTMPSNITSIQCFDSLNCVAASPSGVYHSTDGGLNWSFIAGQGETFASTYFINHNEGWIVLGNSARHTTDGGATWQGQTLPSGTWIYDVMFTDQNNGWAVGDNMVRTTNGGTTWQAVSLPQESLPLWDVDFVDSQHGIAGGDSFLNTESVLITSDDGGTSWSTRTNGGINEVLDMVALDHDHAWASYSYGGKTVRTIDGGQTWRVTEVGYQYLVLDSIDMADLLHGWTVGYDTSFLEGYIYHTNDGGQTWQRQYDPESWYIQAVAALDDQTAITVGGWSGTGSIERRTTDGGNTWQDLNLPIPVFFYDLFFLDSNTGWMVGGNGDIIKTTDGGDSWVVQNNPAQYTLASIHFSDPNNGWAGGYYGTLIRTTDGGATWTLQDPQIPEYTHVLEVHSTGPMQGWIAGYGGGPDSRPFVKRTTDGGATWVDVTPTVGPYDSFSALAFLGDDYGWAAGAGGIFRHADLTCPTITVSPSTLPNGSVGIDYSQTLTASGGTAPYIYAVTSGTLPSGLSLDSTSGVISGTPTSQGTFQFTVKATDSAGCSGFQSYTVNISICTFCDDFEDGILATDWTYFKPSWSESGGSLIGIPAGKQAIAVATPAFSGCQTCSVSAGIETDGGTFSKLSMYGWYVDKKNNVELMIKGNKVVLKQRINGTVVAKGKGVVQIDPNVVYAMRVTYNAGQFTVSVDGNTLFTLATAGAVPSGTVGFAVKNTTGRFAYIAVD